MREPWKDRQSINLFIVWVVVTEAAFKKRHRMKKENKNKKHIKRSKLRSQFTFIDELKHEKNFTFELVLLLLLTTSAFSLSHTIHHYSIQ